MSSSQTPNPKNVTGAEDVVSRHGSALELKKALKKCLRKPRAKLNGETLERGRWGKLYPETVAHHSLALRARDLAMAEGISIHEAYSRLARNARAPRQRGPNGRFAKSG